MTLDLDFIQTSLSYLLRGAWVSLHLAALACFIGLSIGILIAMMQISKNKLLSILSTIYVTIIRGTPMLVQIFVFFYVFPYLGITLSPYWSAVFAIGVNSGAYLSQVIRSGILSIGKGQWEAAQVSGFSRWQTLRYIILPQAFVFALPALGNEFITLIKDSSLASTIGVVELVKEGDLIISRTYKVIPVYLMITLIYLTMTSLLALALSQLEKRMKPDAQNN